MSATKPNAHVNPLIAGVLNRAAEIPQRAAKFSRDLPIIVDATLRLDTGDDDVEAVCVVDVWRDHGGIRAELVAANDQSDRAIELENVLQRSVEACELKAIEIYKENRR